MENEQYAECIITPVSVKDALAQIDAVVPLAVIASPMPKPLSDFGLDDVGHEPTPGMLHAAMFTRKMRKSGTYHFGVSYEKAADVLRGMADDVANGNLLLQTARVDSVARNDDFLTTTLTITFAERYTLP